MMGKVTWKGGTMIYPAPAVIVTCGAAPAEWNMLTVAWTGTVCTNPPMCYISVRPGRHSHALIENNMEFTINLTTSGMAKDTDWVGVKSGRDIDKFKHTGLTPLPGEMVKSPTLAESPLSIECRVTEIMRLGSHDMFMAHVLCLRADKQYICQDTGRFDLESAGLMAYTHGYYYSLGDILGHFGYSVRKHPKHKS